MEFTVCKARQGREHDESTMGDMETSASLPWAALQEWEGGVVDQPQCVVSQFWRPEVQGQGVSSPGLLLWGLQIAPACCPCLHVGVWD